MSKRSGISKIEELLLKDSHIVAIHHADDYDIPEINIALWSSEDRESCKIFLNGCIEYLNSPCIEDDFGSNHDARRAWKTDSSRPKKVKEYYSKNALKYNKFVNISDALYELLRRYDGTNKRKFERLDSAVRKEIPASKDEYDMLATQQKIGVVKNVKDRLYDVLQFLSEQSPPS